jgi:Fur family ferric uptake transcriptional regulator
MDQTSAFNDFLDRKSLKRTSGRNAIVRTAEALSGHFDAEELLNAVRKASRRTSRASVYRTLPLLVKAGMVHESIQRDGRKVYEFSRGPEHHDHMLCTQCGAIVEFTDEIIEKHQNQIAVKYGFTITDHRLVIRGVCAKCNK